ncbi:SNF1-related protein kinase regulatory subunit gamma-1 isoform X2 [Amborella trichopoda]|uniref:SNF1-related protein kinase regulatory subunit gamma-1 isoform X2 n=1 Tax=Amborella trichopoda TaxID=13333 RepID=UPI0009BFCE5E|nr:SNF1-related protein kinase regulatory subunit gamma-1 isoform X2 [Amborella trichopoda]|eukprot:XP_020522877.1 SNF1-related protein kinase regulatory subunit gamma-1 isoform X2 [Amborella trichopoda]
MDRRDLESFMKKTEERNSDEEDGFKENFEKIHNNYEKQGATDNAIQLFLDHIPLYVIPGIHNSSDADSSTENSMDRDIGLIEFSSMVLWAIEEVEKAESELCSKSGSFFSMLDQLPNIGRAKIGELARTFRWGPFLPVQLSDSLLHVLLLLSKHRLKAAPVIDRSDSRIVGFVTQHAAVQLLLHCSGLEWFDSIANKPLSDFGYEKRGPVIHLHGDQSVAEGLHCLWKNRIGGIPILDSKTERLIGNFRSTDVRLLLDNDDIFKNRKKLTMEEFINFDARNENSGLAPLDPIERELGALFSAGALRIKSHFLTKMGNPVTNRLSDTLKQAMEKVAESKNDCLFIMNDGQRVVGMVTLRDMIVQFSPPSLESKGVGGVAGFFETAFQQSDCTIENGSIVCDH